jgi:hypothetical protein
VRGIRYWLVGICLMTMVATYVAPTIAALREPPLQRLSSFPRLSVPLLRIPTLAVPKLHAAPKPAAKPKLVDNTAPATASTAARKRKVVKHRVPVLTDKYEQTPAAATKKKEKKDPFADVPVVDDVVGAPPILSDAPAAPAAAAAAAAPVTPAAPATPTDPDATTPPSDTEQPAAPIDEGVVAQTPATPTTDPGYGYESSIQLFGVDDHDSNATGVGPDATPTPPQVTLPHDLTPPPSPELPAQNVSTPDATVDSSAVDVEPVKLVVHRHDQA